MPAAAKAGERLSRRGLRERHFHSIAVAALALAMLLALLTLVQVGGSSAPAQCTPVARAFIATATVSVLGALVIPSTRSLAGLAGIHLAALGVAALAGDGFVVACAEPASAPAGWLGALAKAWLGTAAVTALGYRIQDHALRSRQTSIAIRRLPAVADARRLLGFLLVASWVTLGIASATAGATALRSGAPGPLPGSEALGSLGILGALSVLLLIDGVRGSSARQRANAALVAYAVLMVTRAGT